MSPALENAIKDWWVTHKEETRELIVTLKNIRKGVKRAHAHWRFDIGPYREMGAILEQIDGLIRSEGTPASWEGHDGTVRERKFWLAVGPIMETKSFGCNY